MRRSVSKRSKCAGFTLVEMMVVLTVMGFLSLGIYHFTVDSSRILFTATAKLDINADMRQATNELAERAREANEFYIYPSFNPAGLSASDRVSEGESGDCLVLVFQEALDPKTRKRDFAGPNFITAIQVFFHVPGLDGAPGPFITFQIDFDRDSAPQSGSDGNSVEELIAANGTNYNVIANRVRGLSDGRMFWMMNRESIMVSAEIFHGNDARRVTNTYNFTISPRG